MTKESRKPRPVSSLALANPGYLRLKLALDQQASLLTAVRKQVPAELAAACLHAQIRDRTLILHVESAAWASRLRYLAPRLLTSLRRELPGLKAARIRVRPEGAGRPSRRGALRSEAAASALSAAAAGIADPELSAALARLGGRLRPDGQDKDR